MANVVIFGIGQMGTVIAYAMSKLGHDLTLVDVSKEAFSSADRLIDKPLNKKAVMNLESDAPDIIKGQDLVISALPYHKTEAVAKVAIELSVPYCDLGGRVDVSANINQFAEEAAFPFVLTDLGLAPGLVNILAEWGYDSLGGADEIKMMVGGLPDRSTTNQLKYMVTWSIDGLLNEYRDACEVLSNGNIELVPGMEGLEKVNLKQHEDEFEAFYTSGGAAHTIKTMQERGVKNCSYKTLRYKGHRDIVRFLIRECELPDECIGRIFTHGCSPVSYNEGYRFSGRIKDIAIVKCLVRNGDTYWDKEFVIPSDDTFTAMQRSTAFSLAAAADLIASGEIDLSTRRTADRKSHPTLSYADIPFKKFAENLTSLGIMV